MTNFSQKKNMLLNYSDGNFERARELLASQTTEETTEETTNTMENGGETHTNSQGKRVRSCRAITLTCWLAFLSFAVIIINNVLAAFRDLATKEEFWQSTNRMIESFEKYKNNSSQL